MNGMRWFRVYSEIKDDPKILELDDHQRWLWICLLAMASESSERGTLTGVRPRGLAAALRTDETRLADCIQALSDLEMIDYDPDAKTLEICHWNDRQYDRPSDTPSATRDRKRKSRSSHADVTTSHADVTTSHATDTDSDSDTNPDANSDTNHHHHDAPDPNIVAIREAYDASGVMLSGGHIEKHLEFIQRWGLDAWKIGFEMARQKGKHNTPNYVARCVESVALERSQNGSRQAKPKEKRTAVFQVGDRLEYEEVEA